MIESKAILTILGPDGTELIFFGGTPLHRRIVMAGFGARKEREAENQWWWSPNTQTLVRFRTARVADRERASDGDQELSEVGFNPRLAWTNAVSQLGERDREILISAQKALRYRSPP